MFKAFLSQSIKVPTSFSHSYFLLHLKKKSIKILIFILNLFITMTPPFLSFFSPFILVSFQLILENLLIAHVPFRITGS